MGIAIDDPAYPVAPAESASWPAWIPVKERLPDRPGCYLVYVPFPDARTLSSYPAVVARYCDCYGSGITDWIGVGNPVTHWMPLPEPPK